MDDDRDGRTAAKPDDSEESFGSAPPEQRHEPGESFGDAPSTPTQPTPPPAEPGRMANVPLLVGGLIVVVVILAAVVGFVLN